MSTLNKTIRMFLDSIGRREDYEFYLNKFKAERSACFALLCPDQESIEAGAEVLAFDLLFLLRLELVPAILLCGKQAEHLCKLLAREAIFVFHPIENGEAQEFIQRASRAEKIPVLVAQHLDLETALLQLVPEVAQRVHLVRAEGGLKNTAGELLANVYTQVENCDPVHKQDLDLLALGTTLMEERPGIHLTVASPLNLLQEIFTVKGAGTLFRKGSHIKHVAGLDGIDTSRLIDLLEASFGKKLKSLSFMDDIGDSYIEQNYRGAVLIENHPAGRYLSKYAVGREARGDGLALELWREVCANQSPLFWRSNRSNPFNSWYRQQADGYHLAGKWQIFWRNIPTASISEVIEYCCRRDEDFVGTQSN